MRARLGINNCFAVRRWPEPADWAPIVADLGLDTVELSLDLLTGPDADPYAWLKHFGPRVPEVQLQQTDGLGDRHWPFTEEHNAGGRVDPGLVLDILADAGAQDVLLILEVIPAFEADDRQVVDGLRASVQVWARALSDRGLR